MRVPVYESKVRTQAIDAPKVGVAPTGLDDLAKGISQVGAAASNIGEDLLKEQDQQFDLMASNGILEWEREKTATLHDSKDGLYTLTGESVYVPDKKTGKSRDMVARERLNAKAAAIIDSLPEAARERTKKALEQRVVSAEREIEGFTGKSVEEAKTSSVKANIDMLERKIEAGEPMTDGEIDVFIEPIRKFIPSPEAFAAISTSLKSKRAMVDVKELLDAGDPDNALLYIDQKKGLLGDSAIKYTSIANKMIKQRDIVTAVDSSVRGADSIYKSRSGEPAAGWVDHEKARAAWSLKRAEIAPADRADADTAFEHELALEAKTRKATIATHLGPAIGAFSKRNATSDIDPKDAHFLETHAPEEWRKFKDAERNFAYKVEGVVRARASAGRAAASGDSIDRSSETVALMNLRRFIVENPQAAKDMTSDEFILKWGKDLGSQLNNGAKILSTHVEKSTKDGAYLVNARTRNDLINKAVRQYELNPKKGKLKAAELRQFISDDLMSSTEDGAVVTADMVRDATDRIVAAQLGRPDPVARSERRAPVVRDEPAPREAPAPRAPSDSADFLDSMLSEGKPKPTRTKKRINAEGKVEYLLSDGSTEVVP